MLNKLVRRRGAGGNGAASGPPTIYVGAFGKHPAWHDHIHPAIGLEGRLTGVMETLYLGGIQKSIAAWREASPADLVPFAHLFVWQTPADVVVGRMWHSRDAANPPRTDYPMVVCVQCANVSMEWALANVPPALDRLEAACKATTKRDGVEAAVDATREELRQAAGSAGDFDGDPDGPTGAVVALADDPRVGSEGLRRVEYVLHEASPSHPRQARVPRAADTEAAAVLKWSRFMDARFGDGGARDLARVLVAPAGGEWVDLILGNPDASHFRTLRFATNLVAPDTETAYSLDAAFVRDADAFLARARAAASRPIPSAPARNGGGVAAARSGSSAAVVGAGDSSGLGMTEVSADAIAKTPAASVQALSPLAPARSVDEAAPPPKAKAARGWKDLVIWVVLGIVLAVAVTILVIVGRIDPGTTSGR